MAAVDLTPTTKASQRFRQLQEPFHSLRALQVLAFQPAPEWCNSFFSPFVPISINSRQPVPFSKTPFKIRKKIYTSREDWMGRCPKKLQGGSRKSAVQKVLILSQSFDPASSTFSKTTSPSIAMVSPSNAAP